MKNFKLFLLILILFGSNQPTKSCWFLSFLKKDAKSAPVFTGTYDPKKTAFISDFHDVLTKPERQKKAFPGFWAMSNYNKAKFTGRVIQYYFNQIVTSNIWSNSPKRCNEFFTLVPKDPNYQENAIKMLNSDTIIPANIAFLEQQKADGAYIAVCSNNGPVSTKYVNQENNHFLDSLCLNKDDQDTSPAIWIPNPATDFVKKHYPSSKSYETILRRIAAARPDGTETEITVIAIADDKTVNLAAAQTALTLLQSQQPPILSNAQIVPIKIENPDNFVDSVKKALNIDINQENLS